MDAQGVPVKQKVSYSGKAATVVSAVGNDLFGTEADPGIDARHGQEMWFLCSSMKR